MMCSKRRQKGMPWNDGERSAMVDTRGGRERREQTGRDKKLLKGP